MDSFSLELDRYQAVIFDMDGTLLDSSTAIREVFHTWCQRHQLDLEQVLTMCHGSRVRDFLDQLAPHLDADEEDGWLFAEEARVTTGVVPISGASEWLQRVSALNMPWGIATSSNRSVALARLNAANLPVPEVLITGDQVEQGKPHPQHFLLAAEKLGVNPARCLAFEDSPNGILSAQSAGCDVIVIGESAHASAQAQQVVARLRDYQPLLAAQA
ncbi:HAD-IA family hydrolase [Bowmanella denitrificans]|uniref:HAD-IA family hydrolase n=1 Tax=Bowmanella denitrificans TaxID=366582 RepID=A0ABN0XH44_9ALTE|nr:HAD-IA family hydrolase [Bowmanella denitrificans]